MARQVNISVRALVEYVFSSGSIEGGFHSARSLTEGTKAHQRVQKGYGEADRKEVYVQTVIEHADVAFVLDGRCDGLLLSEDGITVDEIKSTSGDVGGIAEDQHPVHWAQAMCYAYMVALEQRLDRVHVQLTYVHVDTDEQRQFRRTASVEELTGFVQDVVARYAPYAALKLDHEERRNRSIKELPFPFDTYREGQRKLAGVVYKTIAEEKQLFARAPTGIGKTISTLFPAVKAVGEGLLQRIFYLTAKTIARTTAEEAFSLMQEQGLCLQTVTITEKDKICFKEETICHPSSCEFADGYYDRINEAILDLLAHETTITRPVLEVYALKHRVCPFEFSLDAAYAVDAVICDYNYIFDPKVSLKRLFEEQKKETVLLADEAHNLVDRAREMYSAELAKSGFLQLKREYKAANPALAQAAGAVNRLFIDLRKACGEGKQLVRKELPEELVACVEAFLLPAEQELAVSAGKSGTGGGGARAPGYRVNRANRAGPDIAGEAEGGEVEEVPDPAASLMDLYFASRDFVRTAKYYDERFVTYAETDSQEVRIKLFCLDPSQLLQNMSKGYRAKVFFSATLSPLPYYMDMLGGDKEGDYALTIPTPYAKEQLDVFLLPVSTRYRDRDAAMEPIARMLHRVIREHPGNVLVFFPSYEYMNAVYGRFIEESCPAEAMLQDARMTEEAREQFLTAFQAERDPPLIGFAVLGGIFAEGIDLKGDRLTGVVVVGVGLPQIGLERNLIKEFFERQGKSGYDYAYVFPGMNKVMQAGGRLIRSERDRGTLVLVDDRFLQRSYQTLLPPEWREYTRIDP